MSISIAYHASHEQFAPSRLLSLVKMAEAAGFDAIHSSDHFHPWSSNQAQGGFSFSWIGAAMQSTDLPFSMVCAPGQRYHPAIVAQAIATLAEMFPGRFSVELGSGEALNECITGEPWPSKEKRNQRLLESVNIIRRLLQGEEVSHEGMVNIKEARLYTLPAQVPALFCAAISATTAQWAASWADGLLTTGGTVEQVKEKYEAFTGEGNSQKPVYVQYAFSFAPDYEQAVDGAMDQWKTNLLPMDQLTELYKPQQFDEAAAGITRKDVEERIDIITSMAQLFEKIEELEQMNINRVILHNVNCEQEAFIKAFAKYKKEHRDKLRSYIPMWFKTCL